MTLVNWLTRSCPNCGKASVRRVTPKQAAALLDCQPVQDIFPDLDIAEREVLISGTHPACWTAMCSPR